MQQAGVDEVLIRARLDQGISRALPFRFVAAAYETQLILTSNEAFEAVGQRIRGQAPSPSQTVLGQK